MTRQINLNSKKSSEPNLKIINTAGDMKNSFLKKIKKGIGPVIVFMLLAVGGFAQDKSIKDMLDQGIKLYDNKDYNGAIELYKKILANNPKLPNANYEIATSYFALKDYENTIKHCNVVIEVNLLFADQAYMLKGSAEDLQGKPQDAVKTYRKGIGQFPENHLLYYNLALTSFNLKDYKTADEALMKALKINPAHASSHLLLGYSMNIQRNRVKSILALSNFLMLEPTGNRAVAALELMEKEFKKDVKKEGDNSVSVTVPHQNEPDDFNTAELMLSLLESSNMNEANKDKSSYELFTGNMKSLFTVLGELKKESKGFWWDYYVDFFYILSEKDHVEAFSYYISQSKKDNVIYKWLDDNKEKYDAFSDWYTGYKRK